MQPNKGKVQMTELAQPDNASPFQDAMSALADEGVFKLNDLNRDGHTSAMFEASGVDITGSRFTHREVSEKDWVRLLGYLLAAAADRGLRPAELLAIGMATMLKSANASQ
jgi:hypothetical protein